MEIEVKIRALMMDPNSGTPIIILKDVDSDTMLPIWVGAWEGDAIALACRPALLIADEPTTALDVTVQADVLALLDALIAEEGTALVFITHDVALVSEVAQSVLVMRDGRIVEHGATDQLVRRPGHEYTAELVAAARRTSWAGV